jgi:hypothetical protein
MAGFTKDDQKQDQIGPEPVVPDDQLQVFVEMNKNAKKLLDQFHRLSKMTFSARGFIIASEPVRGKC